MLSAETHSDNQNVNSENDISRTNRLTDSDKIIEVDCTNDFFYVLADDVAFSSTEYKILRSLKSENFLKCNKIKYNGKEALYYSVGNNKPLEIMLQALDAQHFLYVLDSLFCSIALVRDNGFLLDTKLDMRIDRIYVNPDTYKVCLAYLPINDVCYDDPMYLENELRKDLVSIINNTPSLQMYSINHLAKMMDEPACSFSNIMLAVHRNIVSMNQN